jgi:hypothetical protein
MKRRLIPALGALVGLWSGAELIYDATTGNPFEVRHLVFLTLGVAIVVTALRASSASGQREE